MANAFAKTCNLEQTRWQPIRCFSHSCWHSITEHQGSPASGDRLSDLACHPKVGGVTVSPQVALLRQSHDVASLRGKRVHFRLLLPEPSNLRKVRVGVGKPAGCQSIYSAEGCKPLTTQAPSRTKADSRASWPSPAVQVLSASQAVLTKASWLFEVEHTDRNVSMFCSHATRKNFYKDARTHVRTCTFACVYIRRCLPTSNRHVHYMLCICVLVYIYTNIYIHIY